MDKDFWMQACDASKSRPVAQRQEIARIAGGVAVSGVLWFLCCCARFDCVTRPAYSRSQVALFTSAAVMSGVCYGLQRRLLLWRRRGWEVVGDRIWKHLSTYSGWMCAGCAAGVVASAITLRGISPLLESQVPGIPDRQKYDFEISYEKHVGASSFFSPVQLLCTIFAMNMLLRRVSDHASHR